MQLVKNFSMKASCILCFTFFTLNIVWGKPIGGGAPTSWLIGPPIVDLALTGCINCNVANLTSKLPTVRCVCCTKAFDSQLGLSPLLNGSDVCACLRSRFQWQLSSPHLERTNRYKLRRRFQRQLKQRQKTCHLLGLILE